MGSGRVYVDCETTGLQDDAEMIEVAVVDDDGRVLFESLLRPVLEHETIATDIHGITLDMLASAPLLAEVADQLAAALEGSVVVAHNRDYDISQLEQAWAIHGLPAAHWAGTDCTMEAAAARFRPGQRISLHDTMAALGIDPPPGAHRATRDAQCARLVDLALHAV
ncbi:3'-5' exonuclease [Sinomonas sp. JGH33]|uniref:3'-5' exonuclease n=1 Tax=Sinomonas terricola TaxID=3110330 RepID=A0ABU5TC99_9MICC|nr:3'-5' exonuclease [Sinomonas sp. JGH33]MEA5457306.1 3'-5' exonuclease [Sinomonas sp. JGH33]